jgi:hypothetical protein
VSGFEQKLQQQARERMGRIRMEASSFWSIPQVPEALAPRDTDDGFLPPATGRAADGGQHC